MFTTSSETSGRFQRARCTPSIHPVGLSFGAWAELKRAVLGAPWLAPAPAAATQLLYSASQKHPMGIPDKPSRGRPLESPSLSISSRPIAMVPWGLYRVRVTHPLLIWGLWGLEASRMQEIGRDWGFGDMALGLSPPTNVAQTTEGRIPRRDALQGGWELEF